jgi:hypothetical protein
MDPWSAPRTPPSAAELERRRRDALELNDDVVQGLVVARMAMELGDLETAVAAIDRTLESAKKIVGDLLRAGDPASARGLTRTHGVDDQHGATGR